MKKLHLVHYAPGDPSVSGDIAKLIKTILQKQFNIDELDLTENVPDLFLKENLRAYVKRNYKGEEITQVEKDSLRKMDEMTNRLLAADILILITPMYNFSVPAAVKAWIDSIAQAKKAFRYTEYGPQGLAKLEKSIVVPVTGSTPQNSVKDFLTPYLKLMLEFIGSKNNHFIGVYGSKFMSFKEKKEEFIKNFSEIILL